MKRLLPICIALGSISAISPALGYFDTGNALYASCLSTDSFDVGMCLGTIVGHYDMMMAAGYRCGNESTKNKQQLHDIVVKFLKDNPGSRNNAAADLSFLAFFSSFDCTPPPSAAPKK